MPEFNNKNIMNNPQPQGEGVRPQQNEQNQQQPSREFKANPNLEVLKGFNSNETEPVEEKSSLSAEELQVLRTVAGNENLRNLLSEQLGNKQAISEDEFTELESLKIAKEANKLLMEVQNKFNVVNPEIFIKNNTTTDMDGNPTLDVENAIKSVYSNALNFMKETTHTIVKQKLEYDKLIKEVQDTLSSINLKTDKFGNYVNEISEINGFNDKEDKVANSFDPNNITTVFGKFS